MGLLHPPFTQLKEEALLQTETLVQQHAYWLGPEGTEYLHLKKLTRKSIRKTLIDLVSLRSVCP